METVFPLRSERHGENTRCRHCRTDGRRKTKTGIELAKALDGEIVSGDSVQVYRGMDIGSAKVTKEEAEGVPHHLIDLCDPDEPMSVATFQRLAREAIDDIYARGKLPIIVGGTVSTSERFYMTMSLLNVR